MSSSSAPAPAPVPAAVIPMPWLLALAIPTEDGDSGKEMLVAPKVEVIDDTMPVDAPDDTELTELVRVR